MSEKNEKQKEALFIIDMLKDFLLPDGALFVPGAVLIIDAIIDEIKKAEKNSDPIIFICDAHDENDKEFENWNKHAVKNTPGAQIIQQLLDAITGRYYICDKTRYSGFYNGKIVQGYYLTNLDDFLKIMDIKKIKLTGVCTDICVLANGLDALQRDYKVEIISKACKTFSDDNHNMVVNLINNILQPNKSL